MKTYQEIVEGYQKRRRETVIDTITAGLSFADEFAVDAGLLEETGLLPELTDAISSALPFAIIAIHEGSNVILGKKPGKTAMKDSAYRMLKTGTALGIGTVVAPLTGFWAAIPATMGVRALFDSYHSKALTGRRINDRIDRLRELNRMVRRWTESDSKEEPTCLKESSAL